MLLDGLNFADAPGKVLDFTIQDSVYMKMEVLESSLTTLKILLLRNLWNIPTLKKIFNHDEFNFPGTSSADIYKELPSFENKKN